MPHIDMDQYRAYFAQGREAEALKYAHDIRKFEIELYWKRAAYFWTFIAAAFAGFFAIQKDGDFSNIYAVASLGFVFSLGWYFVNRGSGAWQRNWEGHVDLLEDHITGPLYKTLIDRNSYKIWQLAQPFPFSPSRINNILALYVIAIWLFLLVRTVWRASQHPAISVAIIGIEKLSVTFVTLSIFTIIAAIFLLWKGQSHRRKTPHKSIELWVRSYRLPKHPPSAPQ
jgi:hypothetical protein